MKELKMKLLRFSVALWKGEMENFEQIFISLNTSLDDTLIIIEIINRNCLKWCGKNGLKLEDIQLQFTTECLVLSSLNHPESNRLFNRLFSLNC